VNRQRKQTRKKNTIRISAGVAVILAIAIVASTVLTLWGNYSRRQYITNIKSNLDSIDRQFMTAYVNYNTMSDEIKSLKDGVVYTPTIADSTDPQLVRSLSLQDLGDLQGSVKRYPYVYIGGNNDHLPYFLDMQGTENQSIEQFYSQMRFLDDKMNTICDELRTNTSSISDAQSAIIYMETVMTSLFGYMIYARGAYAYGLLALKPLDASAYNEDMKALRSNKVLTLDDGVTMQQLATQQQQINK
jgi:hypothetical protein